jgi:cell division protein FtsZ
MFGSAVEVRMPVTDWVFDGTCFVQMHENGQAMSIKLQLPKLTDLRPRLTVIGVGGAGCNAINNMIAAGLTGVDFVVANTDAQALSASSAEHRVQLGVNLTEGLGAGSKPEIGEAAAEEAIEELRSQMAGSHMVFIAGGMGGGTGTGAAAVIARIAREMGILTVGIVTKPFQFEGTRRMRIADIGVAELKKYVDTLIVIPNQNLFRVANERTTFAEAFVLADQVLYSGVACIVDLIIKEGLINLDFADVRTVMSGMGTAMMGTGEASGERRAIMAAEEAIANPLLDDVSLKGARGLLLSISGGRDLTLYEVDEAASRVREEVDPDANIIVGATFDESLGDRVRVSIVASGMMRQADPVGRPVEPASYQTPAPMPSQSMPRTSESHPLERPAAPALRQAPLQPSHHAAPPASTNMADTGDIQRRLSAALQSQEPVDTQAATSWSPSSSRGSAAPQSARQVWHAPGNVLIEETPVTAGHKRQAEPKARTAPEHHEAFSPEMPLEVRRPSRRIPELNEFSPIAQREYRAKTAPAASPQKRPGLFERLSGMGRRADDSHSPTTHQGDSSTPQHTQLTPPARGRAQHPGDRSAQGPTGSVGEGIELPEFFSRDRK